MRKVLLVNRKFVARPRPTRPVITASTFQSQPRRDPLRPLRVGTGERRCGNGRRVYRVRPPGAHAPVRAYVRASSLTWLTVLVRAAVILRRSFPSANAYQAVVGSVSV